MLLKESKYRILEQFYALDFLFFGERVTKLDACCPLLVEDYISTKGALMSIMIEMHSLIEYSTGKQEKLTESKLFKNSKINAKRSREMGIKLVESDKGKENVKKLVKEELMGKKLKKIKESHIKKVSAEKLREATHRLSVDNLLIAGVLKESKAPEKLDTWEGKIIQDAYSILRDALVEKAFEILKGI